MSKMMIVGERAPFPPDHSHMLVMLEISLFKLAKFLKHHSVNSGTF